MAPRTADGGWYLDDSETANPYAGGVRKDYDESLHPRDEGGRWATTAGGGAAPAALTMNPDDPAQKGALAKARADMRKQYASDPELRATVDVLSYFTQGNFKEVRDVAEKMAAGTLGAQVDAQRAHNAATRAEFDVRAAAWRGENPGQPEPHWVEWGSRFHALDYGMGSGMGTIRALNGDELEAMSVRDLVAGVRGVQAAIAAAPPSEFPAWRGLAFHSTYGTRPGVRGDFSEASPDGKYPDVADYEKRIPGWKQIPEYKVGETVSFAGPSSFTRDKNVADDFADAVGGRQKSPDRVRGEKGWRPPEGRLVIELEAGAKGLSVDGVSTWRSQKEFVTQGKFEVVAVADEDAGWRGRRLEPGEEPSRRTRRVTLRHVGVYGPAKYTPPPAPASYSDEPMRTPKARKSEGGDHGDA